MFNKRKHWRVRLDEVEDMYKRPDNTNNSRIIDFSVPPDPNLHSKIWRVRTPRRKPKELEIEVFFPHLEQSDEKKVYHVSKGSGNMNVINNNIFNRLDIQPPNRDIPLVFIFDGIMYKCKGLLNNVYLCWLTAYSKSSRNYEEKEIVTARPFLIETDGEGAVVSIVFFKKRDRMFDRVPKKNVEFVWSESIEFIRDRVTTDKSKAVRTNKKFTESESIQLVFNSHDVFASTPRNDGRRRLTKRPAQYDSDPDTASSFVGEDELEGIHLALARSDDKRSSIVYETTTDSEVALEDERDSDHSNIPI